MADVLRETADGVCRLTLDRPERRDADRADVFAAASWPE
jgi:enoyl-CoA hydratase/carnithine racemase